MKFLLYSIFISLLAINCISGAVFERQMRTSKKLIGYYRLNENWVLDMGYLPWGYYTDVVFQGLMPFDNWQIKAATNYENRIKDDASKNFTAYAQQYGVTPLLGLGGKEATEFSIYMQDEYRSNFVKNVLSLVTTYKYSGIAIDWQSPGMDTIGCAITAQNDLQNFGKFLQELKSQSGNLKIVVRTTLRGFLSTSGQQPSSSDMQSMVSNVDIFDLITYDTYTPNNGRTSGPSSILSSKCDSSKSDFAIDTAVGRLNQQGIPVSKITLSFPDYARLYYLNSGFQPLRGISQSHSGSALRGGVIDVWAGSYNTCGQKRPYEGIYLFQELALIPILSQNGDMGENNYTRVYDSCYEAPYLYNSATGEFLLTYEDGQSLNVKAQWAATQGLAGVSIFGMIGYQQNVLQNISMGLGSSSNNY
ncbi:glycoside hydrolase [Phakopsora pachyrhizi]|uniref:Glycoside hydrolase n=1 Tax=Phakopsora pachyrhizi TaxID=170000 RepID=A0AAV0BEF5_PHAPC|nr:glycoside hydrolase [Phakopsora pachyrhizi]CAH7685636.1 glycoside hydrolase [Phakopsora pachyrhizi]